MILVAAPGADGCDGSAPSPTGGGISNSSSSPSAIATSGHSQNEAATVRPRSRSSRCADSQTPRTDALTSLSTGPLDFGENVTLVSMAAIVSAISDGASDGRLP